MRADRTVQDIQGRITIVAPDGEVVYDNLIQRSQLTSGLTTSRGARSGSYTAYLQFVFRGETYRLVQTVELDTQSFIVPAHITLHDNSLSGFSATWTETPGAEYIVFLYDLSQGRSGRQIAVSNGDSPSYRIDFTLSREVIQPQGGGSLTPTIFDMAALHSLEVTTEEQGDPEISGQRNSARSRLLFNFAP